jgi:hypothetical protein
MDRSPLILHMLAHWLEFETNKHFDFDYDDIKNAANPLEVAPLLPHTEADRIVLTHVTALMNGHEAPLPTTLARHVMQIVAARIDTGRNPDNLWRLAGLLLGLPTMDKNDVDTQAEEAIAQARREANAKVERIRADHAKKLQELVPERYEAAIRRAEPADD